MNSTYTIMNGERVPLHRELHAVAIKYAAGYDRDGSMPRSVSRVIGSSPKEESFLPEYGLKIFSVSGPASERFRDKNNADGQLEELSSSPDIEYATPVFRHSSTSKLPLYVSNQILLKFKPGTSEQEQADLHASLGAKVVEVLSYTDDGYIVELSGALAAHVIDIANSYAESPIVEWANPDFIKCISRRVTAERTVKKKALKSRKKSVSQRSRKTQRQQSVSDRGVQEQWHLDKVDISRAWNITRGSSSVKVAITDDGIDVGHNEFSSRVTDQFDFSTRIADASPKRADDRHGTPVASVAVAAGIKAKGVAPECSLMAVRTSGFLGTRDEADLFRWCTDQGAAVVNCSWGPPDNEGAFPLGDATRVAIDYCVSQGRNGLGTPVVFAAGNGNESVSSDGYAANPQVIAVAACNSEDKRSSYSDRGPEIFICAPSNGGARAIFTADRRGSAGYNPTRGGPASDPDYFDSFGGTSSAAPLVSGVIGLMISANPQLSESEIRQIIRDTADAIPGDPEDFYDRGGHSDSFGYGRINAGAAVAEAARRSGSTAPVSGVPTITAAATLPANGTPPVFEVNTGGRALFAIEVATEAALFNSNLHGTRRNSSNFFGSWERGLESRSPYSLPTEIWNSLDLSSERLFYRAHVADDQQWSNYAVTTTDGDALNAPGITVVRHTDLNTEPAISAQSEVQRTGDAPRLDVNKGGRQLYAVELASDPSLFDHAANGHRRNASNFYASWVDQLSENVPFIVPDSAWNQLKQHDRIWYRAHMADDSSWTNYAVTTSDADAHTAPSFTISGNSALSELVYPSGERFNTVSDTGNPDYHDPNGGGIPLIRANGKRSTRLSANFRLSEFVSSLDSFARISPDLVHAVQRVREAVGQAVKIERGYTRASNNREHASGQQALISSRHAHGTELLDIARSALQSSVSVRLDGSDVLLDVNQAANRTRLASTAQPDVTITGPEFIRTAEAPEFYLHTAQPTTVWIELASSVESMQKMRDTQGGHYQVHRVEMTDHGIYKVSETDWQYLSGASYLHYRANSGKAGHGHWQSIILPAAASRTMESTDLVFETDLADRADLLCQRLG